MKKYLVNYYILIVILLFLTYNTLFRNLIISGILYHIFMIMLVISNVIMLCKLKNEIKCKNIAIIVFFLIWIVSKDIYGIIFAISSMTTLISIGFMESTLIKVLSIFIAMIVSIIALPLLSLFVITFILSKENATHYSCTGKEIYSYSMNPIDKVHISNYYEILSIDDIIYISYEEQYEVSKEEYINYLNTHKCRLVDDVDESK